MAWQINSIQEGFADLRVSRIYYGGVFLRALLLAGVGFFTGCGGDKPESGVQPEEIPFDFSPDPLENRLGGLPGEVYRSQADSAIHWQPWTAESLKLAKEMNRLVLALIALPQQPSFHPILQELEENSEAVEQINSTYVPVLIDGDAAREMGILTADLCAEIGSSFQLPLAVWMTPDADPVAWIPLPSSGESLISELFSQSHLMVGRMWNEDPRYVSKNSRMDQKNRRARMLKRIVDREISVDAGGDATRALRQLTSLYDPLSRTFDEAGGLFPCGALDLLALGAIMEALPEDVRERCREVAGYLLEDLLVSPMFDPLDGGAFSSRRGSTWALPGFNRDGGTQARIVNALLNSYGVTGDQRALERARGVLNFIEEKYSLGNGLFALGAEGHSGTDLWLWREGEIQTILTAEEFKLWKEATGMKSMGNLPSEADPLREHFRANSIAFVKSPEDIAKENGSDPAEAKAVYESARRKLLKVREERIDDAETVMEANAAATFRMVSAYATAYSITGEEDFREKAIVTLGKAKAHFSDGYGLVLYKGENTASNLVEGRAFLYGLALQASLDVAAITLDEEWLLWADDLATTTAEFFGTENCILERAKNVGLIDLPISDVAMLFDESTAGLLSMSGARLSALGRPLLDVLETQVVKLPMAAINSPILHTDVIQATLVREYGIAYIYGSEISEKSKTALSQKPLKGVNRGGKGRSHPPIVNPAPTEILRIESGSKPVSIEELD